MSKTISGLPIAETLTGDELLPVVQDGNTVQATVQQMADLVGNTTTWGDIQGTLSNQTDLQTALDAKVPYTGATGNVNLGEYGLTSGYFQADLTPSGASAVGRMVWNPDFRTTDLGLGGGNVVLHIGQKQVILVVNKTGATLTGSDYQVVKISGAQGQRPKVALAQANNDANSADTIGIVNETITNNQEGFVCTTGTITNINTTGSMQGETWADGDVLYLSGTTAGRLTNIKPQAPIHTVIVGFVIYAHNNQGKIYVKVDNGYELNELHNVRINGVTDGQVLAYDSTLSVWENINQSAITSGNSDKVDGYHVQVDGTGTDPNTIYFKTTGGVDPSQAIWGDITGSIVDQTDLYNALVTGSYATGNWNINASSVDGYSVQVDGTGTDPNTIYFKTTGGTISVDWDDVANTPTTVSGYGITDAVTTSGNQTIGGTKTFSSTITGSITGNADTVDGYNVQVDGTGTDPNTIYFKTTGGTISVDWDNVLNTPTTVAGYGITDVFTETESDARFLGISATAVNSDKVDGYHVQVDGTGTDPNTIYFKTTGGTTSVEWGNISGTLSAQTDLQTALDGKYSTSNPSGYITASALTPYAPINNPTFTGTVSGITKAMVGLGNVDNTADAVKSVSYATSSGNADTVDGYNVQVDGTGTDPNTIYFKTTGGSIGVDWDDISNTPTTVAGYGITDAVTTSGNQTIGGTKTFSSTITGSITGNAGTVTNGVYTTGDQTIGGTKTFSSTISGSISGNAGTVTNGVYTTGDQTIGGIKTFSTELGVPSFAGANRFISGTGDGASLSTYNFALSGWNGMAFYNPTVGGVFPTSTTGVVNFRDGIIEMRGSLRAPIFYDSADTSYYLDPANTGTSMVVAGDVVASNLKTSANTALSLGLYTGTAFNTGGAAISLRGSTTGYNDSGMEFYAGNSERMRINSSGNVGIGTTSPGRRLSIAGGGFAFDDANVSTRSVHWGNGTTYPVLIQGDATNGFITFNTHASGNGPPERMRIDSSGKVLVGAGATASLGKLVVSEASSGTAVIALESQGSWNSQISSTSTGNMIFSNGTNERLKIDSSGNVTASVSMLAPIYYDSNNTGYYLDPTSSYSLRTAGDWRADSVAWTGEFAGKIQYHSNTWYFQATNGWIFRNASAIDVATISNAGDLTLNGQLIVNSGDGSSYIYMADTDEGARVIHCNSNRIGFLTQAGGWGSYCVDEGDWISDMSVRAPIFYDTNNTAFYVNPNDTSNINNLVMNGFIQGRSCADTNVNTANDTGSISIRGSSTTVASMSFHRTGAYAMNMGLGTDNVFRIGGWSASNNCLQMDGSGNLTMLNNVTAYSDARLKTDVVKIENALDKVQQLNGYTYTRTDTGSKQTGVIAQEVMKVLPEVVMGSEDTHYSVAYGNMVGLLIEAIKEQQGQINELKLTIEQLKGN